MAFTDSRFRWMLAIMNGGAVVAARLANIGTAVGPVITLERPSPSADPTDGPGAVRWLGGLRFSGWVSADQDPAAMNVLVDGILIDRIRISRWSHVGSGEDARAVRSFDVFLPPRFGDGGVHQFAIVTANGENLTRQPADVSRLCRWAAAISSPRKTVSVRRACAPNCSTNWCRHRCRLLVITSGCNASRLPAGRRRPHCAVWSWLGPGEIDDTLASLEKQNGADWIAAAMSGRKDANRFSTRSGAKLPGRRGRRLRVYLIRPSRDGTGAERFAADWSRLFGVRGCAGGLWRR